MQRLLQREQVFRRIHRRRVDAPAPERELTWTWLSQAPAGISKFTGVRTVETDAARAAPLWA
jgi:hypothetical protein